MLWPMRMLLDRAMLGLLVDERPEPADPERADYFIQAASIVVADLAGHPDWLGLNADGGEVETNQITEAGVVMTVDGVVPAPRRAVMIAEQLAKRAYENPNAVVAEGSLGPIGGDRIIEEYARTLEPTPAELAYLEEIRATTGIVPPVGAGGGGLWVQPIEVRPRQSAGQTVWYNDLDPRAKPWPVNIVGQNYGASEGEVI